MPKDRDQRTPADPDDWSELTSGRGQGAGGTGYDRLPGEEARRALHDDDSTAEVVPDPLPTPDSQPDAAQEEEV